MSYRFDLSDLRLFLHIVESGSITAGAARAHMALASASQRIRNMEDALGTALLERNRRGVCTTDAGRALAHHARMMGQQMDRLRDELGQYAHGLKGRIRLLCNTSAMTEFLPQALAAFLSAHPHTDIELEEKLSYEVVQAVTEGAADVGIIVDSTDSGPLQTFTFRPDHLVAVLPTRHPLARRKSLSFSELLDQDFVGLSGDSALQQHLGGHATRAGRPLQYRVRLRSFDGICRMVEQRVGVAVIPETAARTAASQLQIRMVPLADPWARRQLQVCVRTLEGLPSHTRALIQVLLDFKEKDADR
ncbi:LysR substrate-binding domain-containing protein [Herbaspirillum sp. alder98]|uniref:LysR substrate-binding domain-containing protein n=1 Tax=Herbaspirillum sp. alder98 TaxID=2913096 RepID=UPI001CD86E6F|nr:LysR substrate-binding domain-containing protein [Herbaspirillum sp. alder98]MCA1325933.1 LysR family transcriptional regulator [Herbaspirillum sp. alder98]